MKYFQLTFIVAIIISSSLTAGEIKVMFWNVENLFDCKDDPLTKDELYTPSSSLGYNEKAFLLHIEHLSEIINDINPDIIALAEIENRFTLEVLKSYLYHSKKWVIIHKNSQDPRGIDVAILYRLDKFNVIDIQFHPLNSKINIKTRDILELCLQTSNSKFLTLFLNHWPSRYKGKESSELFRLSAANTLIKLIKKRTLQMPDSRIIALGDFNDTKEDSSIKYLLRNKQISLCYSNSDNNKGSYYYNEKWFTFDHIFYTSSDNFILNSSQIYTHSKILIQDNINSEMVPYRFIKRGRITGGFSDHLPVILIIND